MYRLISPLMSLRVVTCYNNYSKTKGPKMDSNNNAQYLNEQNYQRAKKKITILSLIVLFIGIIAGISIIICGIFARQKAEDKAAANQAAATARLAEIEKEQLALTEQIAATSCGSINIGGDSWFSDMTQCADQEASLRKQQGELEQEAFLLKHSSYEVLASEFIMYYVFGGMAIVIGAIIAGCIYIFAKKREIHAFAIQQSMPVFQEAIGQMTPTIGNAAKEITKGINEGLNSQNNNPSNNDNHPSQ